MLNDSTELVGPAGRVWVATAAVDGLLAGGKYTRIPEKGAGLWTDAPTTIAPDSATDNAGDGTDPEE